MQIRARYFENAKNSGNKVFIFCFYYFLLLNQIGHLHNNEIKVDKIEGIEIPRYVNEKNIKRDIFRAKGCKVYKEYVEKGYSDVHINRKFNQTNSRME